jgi:hypothetical protein
MDIHVHLYVICRENNVGTCLKSKLVMSVPKRVGNWRAAMDSMCAQYNST